jgi:hypothetical protein
MMRQVHLLALGLTFALAACGGASVRSTQFRGPDGATNWWAIRCRGDNGQCLREAGEVCLQGYDVVDRSSHDDVVAHSGTVVTGSAYLATAHTTTSYATVTNGEMTIRCRGAVLTAPPIDSACGEANLNLRPSEEECHVFDARRFLAHDAREIGRDRGSAGER